MSFIPLQRVVTAVLTTAFAAALVGACGEEEPDLPTPVEQANPPASAVPTPTSALDPAEAEAVDEVLALYEGYLTTYMELATSDDPPTGHEDRAFLDYAEAGFATEARNQIVQNFIDGRVFTGSLNWTLLELREMDLERTVDGEERPQVVFRVCVDGSTWTLVERESGASVADPPGNYTSTVTAEWREEREFGPDGWGLLEQADDRSEAC